MANNAFTPEQISQILEEFFRVVGTRQYIGARYVPIFGRKGETSIQWDNSAPYEPLTIVLYQGNSYTSRQYVPAGVEIANELFWALTGNYNAQVEEYRREATGFDGRITENERDIATLKDTTESISDFLDSLSPTVYRQYEIGLGSMTSELIVRKPLNPIINNVVGENGICVFDDGYIAISVRGAEDDTESYIVVFDNNNNIVSNKELPIGHGNSLSVNNDIIVTASRVTQKIVFINASNKNNLYVERTLDSPHDPLNATWYDDETVALMYFATGSTRVLCIDLIDATTGAIKQTFSGIFNQPERIVLQGLAFDERYAYVVFAFSNVVTIYDKATFNQLGAFVLPDSNGYISQIELENVYFANNSMYTMYASTVDSERIPVVYKTSLDGISIPVTKRLGNHRAIDAIVDYENGSDIVNVNSNSSNPPVFRRLSDALRYCDEFDDAVANITIRGNYPLPGSFYKYACIITLDSSCTITSDLTFRYCNVRLTYDDGNFVTEKVSDKNALFSQTSVVRFFYSDVYINKNSNIYSPSENGVTRANNGEFLFYATSCNVQSNSCLESIMVDNDCIVNTIMLLAPFAIQANNVLNARSVICSRDTPCFIHPACKGEIHETLYRDTYNASNDTNDFSDASRVIMLRSALQTIWNNQKATIYNNTNANTTFNHVNCGAIFYDQSVKRSYYRAEYSAWPTNFHAYNGTLNGCHITNYNVLSYDGSSATSATNPISV